ncbi:cytochrome P460 family protein [Pseudomonas sp. C11]|uniref:cytochrome P460 family protein n=1 Tax=Pseudomonas sp. C11 TaxID=3075550 RepID=UPI002AFF5A6E|nr:cytochrome P460 family protein [Pseudomonas sp. C11]
MKVPVILLAASAATGIATLALAQGNDRVEFPQHYKDGVHYTTVERGNIREELYVNREAIEAAKNGGPLPSGTVITMEDYRDGRLFRYVVMEKREGWGERYAQDIRNGDWEFQSFQPDRTVNQSENVTRCMSCHKAKSSSDFLFTLDRMQSVQLGQAPSSLLHAALLPEEGEPLFAASAPEQGAK